MTKLSKNQTLASPAQDPSLQEAPQDEWEVISHQEVPLKQLPVLDRNRAKLVKVTEAFAEFTQRTQLIMECIQNFIEKIKIDLTVRFTKHISLDHFAIMDGIFRGVERTFEEAVKEGAHAEFEWRKSWRQYEEQ